MFRLNLLVSGNWTMVNLRLDHSEFLCERNRLINKLRTSKSRLVGNGLTRKMNEEIVLVARLIKTTRRLTFDIIYQHPDTIYMGEDDGEYFAFTASNGYQVISRSRMDIQTERIWLLGAKHKEESRSGTMVFSSDEKRDKAYDEFIIALEEWADAFSPNGVVDIYS